MSRRFLGRCVETHACVGVFLASVAFAQPTRPQPETPWPSRWTVTTGVESFWWRNVALPGPPVDGSPVSWEGQGPIVWVSHDRGSRSRLHHFEGSFAWAGGFEMRSPIRTQAAPESDGVSRLSGRYEYRRYPWRDLWTRGLDLGIGVEGSLEHLSLARHLEPEIERTRSLNTLGVAFVVAARWERGARWSLAIAWTNGLNVNRSTLRYHGDVESSLSGWGGGWQSNLEVRGNVRLAPRAVVTAAWFTSGEGRFARDPFTFGRNRFTAGVTYGR
jgi:hypothetical protein